MAIKQKAEPLECDTFVAKGSAPAKALGCWVVTDTRGKELSVQPGTHRLTVDRKALLALRDWMKPEMEAYYPDTHGGERLWWLRYVTVDRVSRSGRGAYAYWWVDLYRTGE
jgi:hypothetical protein